VHPLAERRFLEQIQLSGKPELSYAPDEDMFDLTHCRLGTTAMMCCVTRSGNWTILALCGSVSANVISQVSYSELSELFDRVFFTICGTFTTPRNTSVVVLPSYAGDRNGQLPFSTCGETTAALATLQSIFAEDAFKFPRVAKQVSPSRWRHWGRK